MSEVQMLGTDEPGGPLLMGGEAVRNATKKSENVITFLSLNRTGNNVTQPIPTTAFTTLQRQLGIPVNKGDSQCPSTK